jgi:sec-independent protein translocase protein TatB
MFDVGIWELAVIGVVALVVLGPERLPKVARTAGHLFGRLQRYVAQVKSDINREMEAAELGKVKSEFESAAQSIKQDVETQAAQTDRELRDVESEIDRQLRAGESGISGQSADPGTVSPAAVAQEIAQSPQLELAIDEPGQAPAPAPASRAAP